jgi:hypothetical protein
LVGFSLRHTLSEHGPVTRGICRTDTSGRLVDVTETFKIERTDHHIRSWVGEYDSSLQNLTGLELVSMNMWGFQASFIDDLRIEWDAFYTKNLRSRDAEFYIPEAVATLIRSGVLDVDVEPTSEVWFGLTNPGDEESVGSTLAQLTTDGVYPHVLWD